MPHRHTLTRILTLSQKTSAAGLHLMGTTETYMFDRLHAGRRPGGRITIGRHIKSTIHIQDPYVSVRHAYVAQGKHGTWEIGDRSSYNGTWVDGEPIDAPIALTAGTRVRIGDARFIVVNPHGLVPLTACSVGEFCFLLLAHDNLSAAARRMDREEVQREFIRTRADRWRKARTARREPARAGHLAPVPPCQVETRRTILAVDARRPRCPPKKPS